MVALPSLLGVGLIGNLFAIQLGYRMKDTPLFVLANILWVLLLVITFTMEMPASGALGALSDAAADAAAWGEHASSDGPGPRFLAISGVSFR